MQADTFYMQATIWRIPGVQVLVRLEVFKNPPEYSYYREAGRDLIMDIVDTADAAPQVGTLNIGTSVNSVDHVSSVHSVHNVHHV